MRIPLIVAGVLVAALAELLLYVGANIPWQTVSEGQASTAVMAGLFWLAAALAFAGLANWLVAKGQPV